MMAYHLGWEGEKAGPEATGKRIRPLLVLLTCSAAGGNWKQALPAAAAVELIHNFSLLHDDIEDRSPLRRGRPTVWVEWGIPQAINTGDAMFSLAHLVLLNLKKELSQSITLDSAEILQQTCLALTQGQHLDIAYEDQENLHIDDYWLMIGGKTAALLSACTELGALAAGTSRSIQQHYQAFGFNLGLAFQVLDDLLGIWGDAAKIGKSNASDLVTGKKTLPVLYGLEKDQAFAARWQQGNIIPEEVPTLAWQLETEGARTYTQMQANRLTEKALDAFTAAQPQGDAGEALRELANRLLQREQ
jgi:geranylgeranyl diphosphate synthase type I